MDLDTAQALVRFGLGRRGGEPLPGDPRAWLRGQLAGPDPASFDGLPDAAAGLAAQKADRLQRRDDPGSKPRAAFDLYRADAEAQLAQAVTTGSPFRERLVLFWANHFTVSLRNGNTQAIAGAFVREAIRPHVTGRFADMASAVMHHPAMLIYLNNNVSIGPNSRAGRRTGRGLNENLAREFMELHTVGVASGYTQADVTSFAAVLTGWSVQERDTPYGFLFRPFAHEPGEKVVLGRTFPEGEAAGEQAIAFLANHPATHRHLAGKLATYFITDDPPATAVAAIEARLRDTGGDLGAAAAALIAGPWAWSPPARLAKLRQPTDYVLATVRATGISPLPDPQFKLLGSVSLLGQRPWTAPLPNGWPDSTRDWSAPEALLLRADWAYALAGRAAEADPAGVAETALGPLLHPATLTAIQHAGSRRDALTLALASPEFFRR